MSMTIVRTLIVGDVSSTEQLLFLTTWV